MAGRARQTRRWAIARSGVSRPNVRFVSVPVPSRRRPRNAAYRRTRFFRPARARAIAQFLRRRDGVQSRGILSCARAMGRMVDRLRTPRARYLEGIDSTGCGNVPFAAGKPARMRQVVGVRPVDSRTKFAQRDRPCGGRPGTGRRQVLRGRCARRFSAAGSPVQRRRACRARITGHVARRICRRARCPRTTWFARISPHTRGKTTALAARRVGAYAVLMGRIAVSAMGFSGVELRRSRLAKAVGR